MHKYRLKLFATISTLLIGLMTTSPVWAYSNFFGVGDSLSDVGNLFLATGGSVDPTNARPQDPPYSQGRFSDGPVFVEYLYDGLGLPGSLTPSFAGGTNYAVGGARTRYHAGDAAINSYFDPSDLPFDPLDPVNGVTAFTQFTLQGQVASLLATEGPDLDSQALYSLWIGSNDVADAIRSALLGTATPTYLKEELLTRSARDVGDAVRDLVGAGAYHLLLPTVPDLSLTPEIQALNNPGASFVAQDLSALFNSLVDEQLAGIDADIVRLDVFAFLNELVDDPTGFGLPGNINKDEACFTGFVGMPGAVLEDPCNYLFFDSIHPSAVTHQVLGAVALRAVPVPTTIALLLFGFTGLIASRRASASMA